MKSSEDLVELYFMVQCSFTLYWVAFTVPVLGVIEMAAAKRDVSVTVDVPVVFLASSGRLPVVDESTVWVTLTSVSGLAGSFTFMFLPSIVARVLSVFHARVGTFDGTDTLDVSRTRYFPSFW